MALLQCDNVAFGYAGATLFRGVSFSLEGGDRLGVVAPNGAGKTTLLRVLARELEPDAGRVIIPREARVGYLTQASELPAEATVLDALLAGFGELVALRQSLLEASDAAARGDASALTRLSHLQDRYDLLGGHALENRVHALAGSLGFGRADMARAVASLSGGERGRLALAVVLASDPEVLLLDEPTNHLDVETTERLEALLRGFAGAVVVVSHDRAFLDATCGHTGELGARQFRLYHAPYSRYLELREEVLAREEAAREQQSAEIARTEEFIRRNLAGQKTKQAQSRRKRLEKLERIEAPEDVWAAAERLRFRFAEAPRSGEIVLDAQGLGAVRGGRTLFRGVELLVRRGDRVAIVGDNGAGKTTLLRLLAGQRDAALGDVGDVRVGSNVVQAYFDQHLESLDPTRSAIDEIRAVRGDLVVDAVREYLGRFQFSGDDPFRQTGSLSGGERTRLALAKMLLVPRNFLLLDEPTNHLDIPSTEILEEALASFDGAVVLVSHDRFFLDRVSTRVLHVHRGDVTVFSGGWSDFRRAVAPRSAPPPAAAPSPAPDLTGARESHGARRAKQRADERRARRIAELEGEITRDEAELAGLRAQLVAGGGAWEKVVELAERERMLTRAVEQKTEEWGRLHEEGQ